jgi:hypothetical protein
MKYAESKTLLAVRTIKEHLHEKREQEGAEAFFARINLRANKRGLTAKPKTKPIPK